MSLILQSTSESQLKAEMFRTIENQLSEIKAGAVKAKRILLVVPAQSTLQTEEDAFNALDAKGFVDLQVMSGSKLKTIVLSEVGSPDRTVINTLGRTMLLRRIIKEQKPSFKAFSKVSDKDGFLDLAADFIVLSKQNLLDPRKLEDLSKDPELDEILSNKLSDMESLLASYQDAMEGKFTDSEDQWIATIEAVSKSSYIAESIVWYYGFYSFTNVEYSLIHELNRCSCGFNIALLGGQDRYIRGGETSARLSEMLCTKQTVIPAVNPAGDARVIKCSSPYTQAETIACDILKKKKAGIDYKDMMVLTEDMEGMGSSIKRVFHSLGIPFFMDEKRGMQHCGIARLINAFMEICAFGYSKERVLAILGSGLTSVDDNSISALDNYLKEYKRTYDKAFLAPFKYKNKRNQNYYDAAENARAYVQGVTEKYVKAFNTAKTVQEKCTALYDFAINGIDAPSGIQSMSKAFEDANFLDSHSENLQSWEFFINLLDQMVELLGNTEMSSEEFLGILSSCFGDVKIGVLPQAMDAVAIGTVNRSSFGKLHSLYIAGVNDGIIPSNGDKVGILTDDEKECLSSKGILISKPSKVLQLEEQFNIDRTLDTDCQELVLLYCECDASGESLRPSEIIEGYKSIKPEKDIEETESDRDFLQSLDLMTLKLPEVLRKLVHGSEIAEDWKLAYNLSKENVKTQSIKESIFYKIGEEDLNPVDAEKLFAKGSNDYFSPTQLEQYSSCPFKHFLNHGLKPLEIKEFTVEKRDAGTIYHEVLRHFAQNLCEKTEAEGLPLNDPRSLWNIISDEKIETDVKEILNAEISEGAFEGVLDANEENQYARKRIEQMAICMAKYMVRQFRKGDIYAMSFETGFGVGRTLPPIVVETSYGKVHIAGQIDRIDTLKINDQEYIKIIDYKSGIKDFSLDKAMKGYDLQLFVYLEGAMGGVDKKVAGVFYYSLKDPSLSAAMVDAIAETLSEDIEAQMQRSYRLDGVMVNTPEVLKALDKDVDPERPNSEVFKSSSSTLISEIAMNELRKEFKERLETICNGIKSGQIDPKPAIYKRANIGCQFCTYKSICLYDLKPQNEH